MRVRFDWGSQIVVVCVSIAVGSMGWVAGWVFVLGWGRVSSTVVGRSGASR